LIAAEINEKPVALFHPLSLTPLNEHNWCLWKNVSQLLWWDDGAANRLTGEEIRNTRRKEMWRILGKQQKRDKEVDCRRVEGLSYRLPV